MIIGAHRVEDETLRLHEYSPGRSTAAFAFDPQRFAAHETFFVEDVRRWAATRLAVRLPAGRTAVFGVSAGAELALAMGLRHPDIYGAAFCASPGAGYRPPAALPGRLPRIYLVAGTEEPFFLTNATRWADALREAGGDVVMAERAGSHGDAFLETRVSADGGVGIRTLTCATLSSARPRRAPPDSVTLSSADLRQIRAPDLDGLRRLISTCTTACGSRTGAAARSGTETRPRLCSNCRIAVAGLGDDRDTLTPCPRWPPGSGLIRAARTPGSSHVGCARSSRSVRYASCGRS